MIIPIEKKEEYKAVIRRLITLNPSISILELQRRMKEAQQPINISWEYARDLINEIREERIKSLNNETKEDIYAQLKDLVEYINSQLRAIAQEEKLVYSKTKDGVPTESPETRIFAQNNRIKALNSIVDNTIKLLNMKMDLGIIERKIGTADFRIIDMMSALKKIRNGDYSTKLTELVPDRTDTGTGESKGGETGA